MTRPFHLRMGAAWVPPSLGVVAKRQFILIQAGTVDCFRECVRGIWSDANVGRWPRPTVLLLMLRKGGRWKVAECSVV